MFCSVSKSFAELRHTDLLNRKSFWNWIAVAVAEVRSAVNDSDGLGKGLLSELRVESAFECCSVFKSFNSSCNAVQVRTLPVVKNLGSWKSFGHLFFLLSSY